MTATRSSNLTTLFDALAAIGLVAALGVVIQVDQALTPPPPPRPPSSTLEVVEVTAGKEAVVQKPLRLAVTPAQFDDMGKLLAGLGKGYAYDNLLLDKLLDPANLKPYNVVFYTCGGVPENWLGKKIGASQRGGKSYEPNMDVLNKLRDSLRTFVSNGGTLYASDLRFTEVGHTFREFVETPPDEGKPQTVQAEVVMPELAKILGSSTVSLNFDKPEWYSAPFSGKGCEVLLKGRFENMKGKQCESPLMVRFPFGKGTVIFTSFHNEKAQSEVAEKLLRFLVFSAVVAESEAFVTKQTAEDGFKPSPGALIGTPKIGQPIEKNYECSGSPERLRFALAFAGSGVRLKLRIVDPQGRFFEKEIKSTFLGDVRSPANGKWTYSVTPLELPYENFAFTVSVSEKAKE